MSKEKNVIFNLPLFQERWMMPKDFFVRLHIRKKTKTKKKPERSTKLFHGIMEQGTG